MLDLRASSRLTGEKPESARPLEGGEDLGTHPGQSSSACGGQPVSHLTFARDSLPLTAERLREEW